MIIIEKKIYDHNTNAKFSIIAECVKDKSDVFWAVVPAPDDLNSDNLPYKFIIGQRGTPKILYDGFTYICVSIHNQI
jgi:hypothetical protein